MVAIADLENLFAFTLSLFSNSPSPRILIPSSSFFTNPHSINSSGVTSVPSSNPFRDATFTIAYSLRLKFVNPRFGKRLASAFEEFVYAHIPIYLIGFRYEKTGECYAGISHLRLESRHKSNYRIPI